MVTLGLIVVIFYVIYRFMALKKLQKRIEILEKRADKLEREVRFLALLNKDN